MIVAGFASLLPNLGVMILIAIQGMVLSVSIVGRFARRAKLAGVMLVQGHVWPGLHRDCGSNAF